MIFLDLKKKKLHEHPVYLKIDDKIPFKLHILIILTKDIHKCSKTLR